MSRKLALLNNLSILIIESDPTNRNILIDILEAEGAITLFEEEIQNALLSLTTFIPDCIFCNICLIDGNGYSLIETMRQIEKKAGIVQTPAIAIFDSTRSAKDIKSFESGFQAIITKPWNPKEIIDTVIRVTGRKRLI